VPQILRQLSLLVLEDLRVVPLYLVHVVNTQPQASLRALGQDYMTHVVPGILLFRVKNRLLRVKTEIRRNVRLSLKLVQVKTTGTPVSITRDLHLGITDTTHN